MSGELDLGALLRTLTTQLDNGLYVFATMSDADVPQDLIPKMCFREAEGTTLILSQSQAEAHGIAWEFPCRMITLDVHSSLDAVGFIAVIASKLAEAGMGVNPVAGFYHDHLFVPDGREDEALAILRQIARDAGSVD